MIFPSGDILIRIHIILRSLYNCSMEKLAEKRRFSSLFGNVLKMAVCRRAGTRPKSRHPLPNLLWERLLDDPDRQIVRLTNQRITEVGRQESPQAMHLRRLRGNERRLSPPHRAAAARTPGDRRQIPHSSGRSSRRRTSPRRTSSLAPIMLPTYVTARYDAAESSTAMSMFFALFI